MIDYHAWRQKQENKDPLTSAAEELVEIEVDDCGRPI
jgi:hypothetical protein